MKPSPQSSSFRTFVCFPLFIYFLRFTHLFFIYLLAMVGFYCYTWALSPGEQGAVLSHGLSRCGAQGLCTQALVAAVCWVSSCGLQASLLHRTWDLPWTGDWTGVPVLQGEFLTARPPEKPSVLFFFNNNLRCNSCTSRFTHLQTGNSLVFYITTILDNILYK